jgi:hypothetical protein
MGAPARLADKDLLYHAFLAIADGSVFLRHVAPA